MPELPEVETIKMGLSQKIIGLKLKNIQVLNPKSFSGEAKQIIGAKVIGVWRKAKVLGISLQSSAISSQIKKNKKSLKADDSVLMTLLIHLKMSGQLIFENKTEKFIGGHPTLDMQQQMPIKSTRVIFEFSDGSKLYFNDQRKFGWIRLVTSKEVTSDKFLNLLGPEPLEKGFTWQILKNNLLRHKTQAVKVAILDQSVVSGVGNIYACEALFNAKLNPKLKISQLTDAQFKKLHQGIVKALSDGVKYGGSSKTHFVNEEGKKGLFLDYAFVYSRAGEKCKVCQAKIEKIRLGGRGTEYCPACQK